MKPVIQMTIEELKIYVYDASKMLQQLQQEINVCENRIKELIKMQVESKDKLVSTLEDHKQKE